MSAVCICDWDDDIRHTRPGCPIHGDPIKALHEDMANVLGVSFDKEGNELARIEGVNPVSAVSALCGQVGRDTDRISDAREILEAVRQCLNRWAARYAASEHAKKHVKESRLLIERIDEWLLSL